MIFRCHKSAATALGASALIGKPPLLIFAKDAPDETPAFRSRSRCSSASSPMPCCCSKATRSLNRSRHAARRRRCAGQSGAARATGGESHRVATTRQLALAAERGQGWGARLKAAIRA
ncbi:hypothetical protein M8494_05865 [Serratia ureilytica]